MECRDAPAVRHFMRTLGVTSPEELRQADHKAVIAWERYMHEVQHAASSTIRRRLAALSSLYKHLVRHDHRMRECRRAIEEDEAPAPRIASTCSMSNHRPAIPAATSALF
jgi:site-specific recombinase XerD